MIVHFDGDLLVYRAGFAAEKTHYYLVVEDAASGDEHAVHFQYQKDLKKYIEKEQLEEGTYKVESRREVEPVKNALYNVRSLVDTALAALQATHEDMIMYLSGPTNFRDGVATLKKYKGNRDETHKPVHGPAIKEYMRRHYNTVVSVDEEADDVVSYSHYAMWEADPYSSVIVTVDKDLNMIPGLHFNFVKEESFYVSPEQAEVYFLKQLITGDSTDNIPGVPGAGPAAAENAIGDDCTLAENWEAVRTLYVQAYKDSWYDALVENGRLLWMRRKPNEWWNPPKEIQDDRQ